MWTWFGYENSEFTVNVLHHDDVLLPGYEITYSILKYKMLVMLHSPTLINNYVAL